MKRNSERNGKGEEFGEDLANRNPRRQSRSTSASKNVICDDISKKRRRLSKKERKILKRSNELKRSKLNYDKSITTNNFKMESRGNNEDISGQEERTRLKCMESYEAIDIPKKASSELFSRFQKRKHDYTSTTELVDTEGGCRTLGKWFPNAIVMKTSSYTNTGQLICNPNKKENLAVKDPRSSLVLFYQYTTSVSDEDSKNMSLAKNWDRQQLELLITYLSSVARHRNIGGRIRVAPEGVNATLSAVDNCMFTAEATLRHFAEDLRIFDERVFSRTDFKFMDDLPADRHFKEFKILPVQELVYYDIGEDAAPLNVGSTCYSQNTNMKPPRGCGGGIHLDAKEYHKMLQKDNTVVIDVRNNYETILGRFDGQQQQKQNQSKDMASSSSACGAEYIDPKMRKSTDFKSWLATPETQQKLKQKTVLMYCTGGIRCERASSYLKSQMGDQVEGIYQLKGGIERYLKTFKDGGFWRGKNFVFDKREAVSVDNPHGDGGVLRKENKSKFRKDQSENKTALLYAKCCVCGDSWDRYVGKKKCQTCGVPVLMCDKCMSLKPDKTVGMELKVRCPLCVEENITVLAKEVEFTANGIKNKVVGESTIATAITNGHNEEASIITCKDQTLNTSEPLEIKSNASSVVCQTGKAANSVLKWGGGHATEKKKRKKVNRRICQFGPNCFRKDCFFYHPERKSN